MSETQTEKTILNFYTYPPVGGDDWRYAFETAKVRALEMQMLTRATLMDMANASDFASAVSSLGASEYALGGSRISFEEVESILLQRRTAIRELFAQLMHDKSTVRLFKSRDDFANLRLVLRRTLTDKAIGSDYSTEGNFNPELFEQVFSEEMYELLPDYMQQTAEQAILAYYQNKDIRQIDNAIDRYQGFYKLQQAKRIGSKFLTGLFKIEIDLINIKIMLRLKFTEAEQRNVFLDGGFIELERFRHGLDIGYESLGQQFFVTPYHKIIEAGVGYFTSNNSYLKIEQQCDECIAGFLKMTVQVTSGPQPIIAYLLAKEHEIRMVRLLLAGKNNNLETKLLLERIS